MPSYQYMYLVPRDVYDRAVRLEGSAAAGGETRGASQSKGDTLNGNVQGAAQVNHIEMAEGTKLTIKPNRDISAAHGEDDDDIRRRKHQKRRHPADAADQVAAEREAELPDEDENDVPYVVGDEAVIPDPSDNAPPRSASANEDRMRRSPSEFSQDVLGGFYDDNDDINLPPVISGVTEAPAEMTTSETQTDPRDGRSGPSRQTQTARKSTSSVSTATDLGPQMRSTLAQTDSRPPNLRRTAIENWSTVRRAQRGDGSETVRSLPYARLNDGVSMGDKIDMMRKIIDAQLDTMLDRRSERPQGPPITSVTIAPSSADGTGPEETAARLEDAIRGVARHSAPTKAKRAPKVGKVMQKATRSGNRRNVEVAMKKILADAKAERTAARDSIERTMKKTLADAEVDEMERLLQDNDEEMTPVPNKPSPPRKRQTRSMTAATRKKAPAARDQEEEEEAMQAVVSDRLATLEGSQRRRGKRAAREMVWPEEIDRRSGRSSKKKSK